MSLALLKNTIKRNWKLVLIFFSVLCLYLGVIISLIDPQDMEKIKELYGTMGGFLDAFGISIEAMTDPLSYTASTFFGILVMAFTMVFYILQNTKLVAKPVENNSLAYTLSMPISRTKFILTQSSYLIGSIFMLFVGILATGSVMLARISDFNFGVYLNLVGVVFFLNIAIAMLSFLLSIAFCDSKKGFGFSVGIPIGLLLISMLGGVGGEKTKWLVKFSPFGWIDSVGIVNGDVSTWWMYLLFIFTTVILILLSIKIFKRKKLPL